MVHNVEPDPSLPILTVDNLTVKRLIGRGGFAAVYVALYAKQEVALKVLSPSACQTADTVSYAKMFLREAACTKQAGHESIIDCLGVVRLPAGFPGIQGPSQPTWGLVLELCEAYTTKTLITRGMAGARRMYTNLQAYEWLCQIASALSHLHASRPTIIHRDIKQENLLLKKDPAQGGRLVAKLGDLGLHVVLEHDRSVMLRRKSRLGKSRSVHCRSRRMSGSSHQPPGPPSKCGSTHAAMALRGDETPFLAVGASNAPSIASRAPSMTGSLVLHATATAPRSGETDEPGFEVSIYNVLAEETGMAAGLPPPVVGQGIRAAVGSTVQATVAAGDVGQAGAVQGAGASGGGEQGRVEENQELSMVPSFAHRMAPETSSPETEADIRPHPLVSMPSPFYSLPNRQSFEGFLPPVPTPTPEPSSHSPAPHSLSGAPLLPSAFSTVASLLDTRASGGVAHSSSYHQRSHHASQTGMGTVVLADPVEGGTAEGERWRPPRMSSTGLHDGSGAGSPATHGSLAPLYGGWRGSSAGQYGTAVGVRSAALVVPPLDTSCPVSGHRAVGLGTAKGADYKPSPLSQRSLGIGVGALSPVGQGGGNGDGSGAHAGQEGQRTVPGAGGGGEQRRQMSGPLAVRPRSAADVVPRRLQSSSGRPEAAPQTAPNSTQLPRGAIESLGALIEMNPDLIQPVPVHLDRSFTSGLRRVRSVLNQLRQDDLQQLRQSSIEWVFGLTGQAGSCMYMAPEVYRKLPYNEKADVFSFGVVMYELVVRELLIITYFNTSKGAKLGMHTPEDYAEMVCDGYRPPRPERLPDAVWSLVEECWHDDPVRRPPMDVVLQRLRELRDQEAAQPTDGGGAMGGCGCVVS